VGTNVVWLSAALLILPHSSTEMLRTLKKVSIAYGRHASTQRRLISSTSRLFSDPWPLPHTPEHMKATTTSSDTPPTPLPRPNEKEDTLRARLTYQSRKRGILECDLLLSTFAREELSTMSHTDLMEYDKVCPPISPTCNFSFDISLAP